MDVISVMSGNVFKVNVSAGDVVQKGDEIIVIESMKMEVPVTVEKNGSVKKINVSEGDFVQEGQTLAVIE